MSKFHIISDGNITITNNQIITDNESKTVTYLPSCEIIANNVYEAYQNNITNVADFYKTKMKLPIDFLYENYDLFDRWYQINKINMKKQKRHILYYYLYYYKKCILNKPKKGECYYFSKMLPEEGMCFAILKSI